MTMPGVGARQALPPPAPRTTMTFRPFALRSRREFAEAETLVTQPVLPKTDPVEVRSSPDAPSPPPVRRSSDEWLAEPIAPMTPSTPRPAAPAVGPLRREDDLIGALLEDRYRVESLLGKGTFGAVFRGRNERTEGDVAIKVLVPSLVSNATGLAADSLMRRFEVEARVASQLTHPNTVRVFDYGRHGECAFMVMQLLEGQSLMDVIERQGPVEPRRAIAFVRQVCSALQEAHSLGLVHRDIKPHNLMLVQRVNAVEQVKVLDFGTVKSTDKELAGLKLTADGTVLGTAWYMSPEQARGDELDLRSDLYSLGVILFELLTQRLPFDSPQPANVMLQHVMDPPPLLSDVMPDLAQFPKLVGVVSCCLEKDRAQRFDDAGAMERALERASNEISAVLAASEAGHSTA